MIGRLQAVFLLHVTMLVFYLSANNIIVKVTRLVEIVILHVEIVVFFCTDVWLILLFIINKTNTTF